MTQTPASLEPAVGVIIPVWNGAATLEWTLLSLRSQRGMTPRLLAVDSGSNDGTLAILERWGVSVLYEPPGNMYRAINAGMGRLETEWVTWLNSDDLLFPDALSRLLTLAARTGADLAFGNCDYIDAEGRFLFTKAAAPLRLVGPLLQAGIQPFCQPAAIFRREVWLRLGGLSDQFRNVSDLDLFRKAHAAGFRFARLAGAPAAAFRSHPQQLTQRMSTVIREEMRQLLEREPPRQAHWLGQVALWSWRVVRLPAEAVRRLRARQLQPAHPASAPG